MKIAFTRDEDLFEPTRTSAPMKAPSSGSYEQLTGATRFKNWEGTADQMLIQRLTRLADTSGAPSSLISTYIYMYVVAVLHATRNKAETLLEVTGGHRT